MSEKKRFNHRHVLSWLILLAMGVWCLCSYNAYIRLFETAVGCATSIFYAFFFVYDFCPLPLYINKLTTVDVKTFFPNSFESFGKNFEIFFRAFFDRMNFLEYLINSSDVLNVVAHLFLDALLIGVFVWVYFKFLHKPAQNNNTGVDTKPKKLFIKFEDKVLYPIGRYVKSVFSFFWERKYYRIIAILLFLLNTNVISILFSVLGWYSYFAASFDISSLAIELYNLSIDIILMLSSMSLPCWLVVAWIVFDKLTRRAGLNKLRRNEHINKLFRRARGVYTYINGPPRTGKTSAITDMMITDASNMREDALSILLDVYSEFPNFPFKVFCKLLDGAFESGKLKSRAAIAVWLRRRKKKFIENPTSENCFGYDVDRYPLTFDNGLIIEDVFAALNDFAAAYRVYTEMTLFLSTYAIRETAEQVSCGNILTWDDDYFTKPSFDGYSAVYSRMWDQDMSRPGKKMRPDRNVYGVLEYGIKGQAEIDKERGNNLENQETKKLDDECNAKNDLFEKGLMMDGHASMIRFICFTKGCFDAQRESSWGAKGNELAEHIDIIDVSDEKLALPFFWYREILHDFVKSFWDSQTVKDWFNRGDNTLLKYLIDKICTSYIAYVKRIVNTYGYKIKLLSVKRGDLENAAATQHKWYESYKKLRAGVYATDAFAGYFSELNLKTGLAFSDIPQFDSLHPSLRKMRRGLNSHMIESFIKDTLGGK